MPLRWSLGGPQFCTVPSAIARFSWATVPLGAVNIEPMIQPMTPPFVLRAIHVFSAVLFTVCALQAQDAPAHRAFNTIGDITPVHGANSDRGGTAPNALCSGAVVQTVPLFGSVTNTGDNTGAVVDNYFQLPVVWEGFTITQCMTIRVSYCGTTPRFQGALLALQAGCPGFNIAQAPVSAVTNYLCADNNFTITFSDLPAGTYYYPVLRANNSTGPYQLRFSGTPCFGFPPSNNACANATSLVSNVDCIETAGTTANATVGTPSSFGCNSGDPSDDVWYRFVATHTDHTVSVEPREGFDAVIEIRSGSCAGTLIACRDVSLAGVTEVATLTGLTIGETYYVRVYDWYAGASVTNNFTICVQNPACLADAGTLAVVSTPVCLVAGVATVAATANGDAVVPPDFETAYILTEGAGLVIQGMGTTASFDVNVAGSYTIHTLVYDPLVLDLGDIQIGLTTGFDVNALLEQGGGTLCGSLDMVGAPVVVESCLICDADAGTIAADADTVCFVGGIATLTATAGGNATVPPGYQIVYVLTKGAGLIIMDTALVSSFDVTAVGDYIIHTLVYDPLTLDLGTLQFGVTTGADLVATLVQGGGAICANLDVAGAPVHVEVCIPCDAFAGTLAIDDASLCLVNDTAIVSATANGDAVVPTGFEVLYVLSDEAGLVVQAVSSTPSFTVTAVGNYTIHTLVYDPLTLDTAGIDPGVTTVADVDLLLIQGGGTICASLDLVGASSDVEDCSACTAYAGTIEADTNTVCSLNGIALISATPNGDGVVPSGYATLYVLSEGPDLVIQATSAVPEFSVNGQWSYTIHTLIYDPLTFDPGTIQFGVTTGAELNALLVQGGGVICAGLDVAGATITVINCAPENDQCPNATTLLVNAEGGCPGGGTSGDNTYAGSVGDPPSCDTSTAGFADVWYTFNSGASTTVLIDFEHGTMTDWGIAVTTACEGAEVACIVQPASLVDVVVQPGTDYWIRVFSNLQFGAGGAFTICLTGITQICDGGVVSTVAAGTEPIVVCQDQQADVIDFITSSTSTENYSFILTDGADVIVSTITGASVDFNSAPLGEYRVWGVSYNGLLLGADPGGDLSGVAASGGCIDVSDAFVSVSVEICSGVAEQAIGGWSVYPNPSNGDITVLHGSADGLVRLDVFDLAGRTVWQEQWQGVKATPHNVSLGGRLAAGTYSLRLTSASGRSDQRVVIR